MRNCRKKILYIGGERNMRRETALWNQMEDMCKSFSGKVFEQHSQKWIRTRQDILLKYFPKAEVDITDGIIIISPCVVDNKLECCEDCDECRRNYWLAEVGYCD